MSVRPAVGQIWRVVDPAKTLAKVGDQVRIEKVVNDPRSGAAEAIGYRYVDIDGTGVAPAHSFSTTFAPVQG